MERSELVRGVRLVMDELALSSDALGGGFDGVVWDYGVKAHRALSLASPLRFGVSKVGAPAVVGVEALPCGWYVVCLGKPNDYLKLVEVKLVGWRCGVHVVGDVGDMDMGRVSSVVKGVCGGPYAPEVWVDDGHLYCYAVADAAGGVVERFRYVAVCDGVGDVLPVQAGMVSSLIDMTAALLMEGFGDGRSVVFRERALQGVVG